MNDLENFEKWLLVVLMAVCVMGILAMALALLVIARTAIV